MKAIILAAGSNRRLRGVIDVPKTLLKIGSSTVLERQISALMTAGLNKQDIFVVTGYKSDMIKEIHDNIIFNEKYDEYDNAYSVYLALKVLIERLNDPHESFMIFDGDLIYDVELINQILKSKKENILVTKESPYSKTLKDEIILIKEDSEITEMIIPEKGQPLDEKYNKKQLFIYSGILKISFEKAKELRDSLNTPKILKSWYTLPLPNIVSKGGFYNLSIPKSLKFCFDVDTKEDYARLQSLREDIAHESHKLFIAGPVNVSWKVKEAMLYPEIGHREPEFSNLLKDVKQKLLYAFGADPKSDKYSAVVIGGSGTSATETVLSSVLHSNKKTLVVSNGAFGERISEICDTYKIPIVHLKYGWGESPNLNEIEEKINKDKEIEAVTIVLMETSTGMLNQVNQIGKICKQHDKIFIVDAISALGGEELEMGEGNIDYCIANTNKCLGGLPVLGMVCFKKSSLEKSKDVKPRSYYLDLFRYIKYAEKNQTPFTPQIPLIYMLREALNGLIEEGIENRIKRFAYNGGLLKQKLKEIGLKFQLKEEEMSNLMVNVLIPENIAYDKLHQKLKEKGYIIYPGKGPLEGKIIHFANIGTLNEKDVVRFSNELKDILAKLGFKQI